MLRRAGDWLRRHSHVNWALADQAMVSGANFLTGILLARFLGLEGYGQFVLLYAVLLYANTIQSAVITFPMMSALPKMASGNERRRYSSGVLGVQILFGVVSVLLLWALGGVVEYFKPEWKLQNYYVPLSALLIAFGLQDWFRRYNFATSRSRSAFLSDFVSYGGQAGVLMVLYFTGKLTVEATMWAIASTYFLAFCLGYIRENMQPDFGNVLAVCKQNAKVGRDLLLSGQLQWVGTQGVLIIAAGFLGIGASGGIRAAQNVVGPINILYQAMENIVPVRAARQYASGKMAGLMAYLGNVGRFGGGAVFLLCITIAALAEPLMALFYGNGYAKYAPLVIWQALYIFLGFFIRQLSYLYRAVGLTASLISASTMAAIVSVVASFFLIPNFLEEGLMAALIMSQLAMLGVAGWSVRKVSGVN